MNDNCGNWKYLCAHEGQGWCKIHKIMTTDQGWCKTHTEYTEDKE